jgi:hypothetical protein
VLVEVDGRQGKSGFVAVLDEAGQELRVCPGRLVLKTDGLANLVNHRVHAVARHHFPPAASITAVYLLLPADGAFRPRFRRAI